MVQGPPLRPAGVDCGAMCMPGAAEKVAALVDDAVIKGAKVLAGGRVGAGGRARGWVGAGRSGSGLTLRCHCV